MQGTHIIFYILRTCCFGLFCWVVTTVLVLFVNYYYYYLRLKIAVESADLMFTGPLQSPLSTILFNYKRNSCYKKQQHIKNQRCRSGSTKGTGMSTYGTTSKSLSTNVNDFLYFYDESYSNIRSDPSFNSDPDPAKVWIRTDPDPQHCKNQTL